MIDSDWDADRRTGVRYNFDPGSPYSSLNFKDQVIIMPKLVWHFDKFYSSSKYKPSIGIASLQAWLWDQRARYSCILCSYVALRPGLDCYSIPQITVIRYYQKNLPFSSSNQWSRSQPIMPFTRCYGPYLLWSPQVQSFFFARQSMDASDDFYSNKPHVDKKDCRPLIYFLVFYHSFIIILPYFNVTLQYNYYNFQIGIPTPKQWTSDDTHFWNYETINAIRPQFATWVGRTEVNIGRLGQEIQSLVRKIDRT